MSCSPRPLSTCSWCPSSCPSSRSATTPSSSASFSIACPKSSTHVRVAFVLSLRTTPPPRAHTVSPSATPQTGGALITVINFILAVPAFLASMVGVGAQSVKTFNPAKMTSSAKAFIESVKKGGKVTKVTTYRVVRRRVDEDGNLILDGDGEEDDEDDSDNDDEGPGNEADVDADDGGGGD